MAVFRAVHRAGRNAGWHLTGRASRKCSPLRTSRPQGEVTERGIDVQARVSAPMAQMDDVG
jgi:hypothetical protein